MKLEKTLILLFTSLIIFNFKAHAANVDALVNDCTESMNKGNADKALAAAEAALKQENAYHAALLCKGRALGAQGKYAEAQSALEQGAKTAKSEYDAGIAALLLGNLHKDNQNYPLAIASYQKSLSLFQAQKYQRFVYISHMLIGESNAQSRDLNAALASYQAANKVANNDNERADSYARLASVYAALGQYANAIEHQLKSTLMQQKAGTLDQYADATIQLGQYYLLAKDYKNAEITFNKLRDFAKENGGAYYEAKADLLLAQSSAAANDIGAAKNHLAEAQAIANKLNDKELNAEISAFSSLCKNNHTAL